MLTIGSFRQGTAALFGLAALSITAFGADKAVATVSIPGGCRSVIVTTNGVAAGTIQLTYTHVGMTFPTGDFGCFDLNMVVAHDTGTQDPTYPASLFIGQIGGEDVLLTPGNVTMTAHGIGAVAGSPQHYVVGINPAVATIPALNEDGYTIVGNLRMRSSDNKLRTVTNILVKILLVHPSVTNCLKTYHQILDKETFGVVPSMVVDIFKNGQFAGKVNNSNPPGILDSVLVANTCSVNHSFDLQLAPSADFEVQTAAPGNSIHVYTASGEQNFASFATATGTGKGTNYCVSNLVVPSNTTLLTAAALKIKDKNSLAKTALPNGGICSPWTAGCVFDFSAELRTAGSTCTGALVATPPVSTNPLPKSLDFTVQ